MPSQQIDARQLNTINTQNQLLPKEGSIIVPIGPLDLSNATGLATYTLDLSTMEWQNRISMVQGLFIDASTSGVPIAIKDLNTGHEIVVNPHTQGFYTFLSSKPTQLQINGPGGPTNFKFWLLNAPIPGMVWAATHP